MAKFLIDENVPKSVATYLEKKGHEVTYVKEALLEGTPDPVVAKVADDQQSILVTWNIKDFKKERKKYQLGILAFRCPEPIATDRLEAEYDYIEFHLDRCEQNSDSFWVEIQKTGIKIIRRYD